MFQDYLLKEFKTRIEKKLELFQTKFKDLIEDSGIDMDISEPAQGVTLENEIDTFLTEAKEVTPEIKQFLQEVKGKMVKIKESKIGKSIITKIDAFIGGNTMKKDLVIQGSEKEWKAIKEAVVVGSFEEMRAKVDAALSASGWFPSEDGNGKYISGVYIRSMFPTKVVVSYNGFLYQVSYSIVDKAVILGAPKEVEEAYIIKESIDADLKEAKIQRIREARDENLQISDYISLKEAKWNDETSEVEVVLIEAGTNLEKRRHYPVQTIREAAAGFSGLKMYINHPTRAEEKERPERDLKQWASTIVESHFDSGKAIGKVSIHDTWLRERLKDPVAREHIGLSINTGGKISLGKINGQEMQVVEKIVFARKNGLASVDWVTEPGARGRVSRLLEGRTEDIDMLENVTLKEVKESRKDLVDAIIKEAVEPIQTKLTKAETDLKEANTKIAGFEKTTKTSKQLEVVETTLKEAKIPDAAKEKVRDHFKTNLVEGTEVDLKEAIGKKIKAELDYVNKISGKGKIQLGEGSDADVKESIQNDLDNRAGVAKKEKKD